MGSECRPEQVEVILQIPFYVYIFSCSAVLIPQSSFFRMGIAFEKPKITGKIIVFCINCIEIHTCFLESSSKKLEI